MLPLSLLSTSLGHPMLVELKSGETFNGSLAKCDTWMNILLQNVVCTSADGDLFWELKECFIRGTSIKYLRMPDQVLDQAMENQQAMQQQRRQNQNRDERGRGRGGRGSARGGRGRGGADAGRGGRAATKERGRGGRGAQSGDQGGRFIRDRGVASQ